MASKHLKITGKIIQQWNNSLHGYTRHVDNMELKKEKVDVEYTQ